VSLIVLHRLRNVTLRQWTGLFVNIEGRQDLDVFSSRLSFGSFRRDPSIGQSQTILTRFLGRLVQTFGRLCTGQTGRFGHGAALIQQMDRVSVRFASVCPLSWWVKLGEPRSARPDMHPLLDPLLSHAPRRHGWCLIC